MYEVAIVNQSINRSVQRQIDHDTIIQRHRDVAYIISHVKWRRLAASVGTSRQNVGL